MMCGNALNSRGKPAVSPMSGSPTFDIDKKNRNGANLKQRHALRAGGVTHRDYKRIEWASREKSREKLNKSNGGSGI